MADDGRVENFANLRHDPAIEGVYFCEQFGRVSSELDGKNVRMVSVVFRRRPSFEVDGAVSPSIDRADPGENVGLSRRTVRAQALVPWLIEQPKGTHLINR